MSEREITIDTINNVYSIDGKDVGSLLTSVEVSLTPYSREVRLTSDTAELNISGTMFCDESINKPIICECGNKLSDHRFDCNCLCPKCKRHIIVSAGLIVCDQFA